MSFPSHSLGTGTDQELLDLCRAAIAQILLTGQSYTIEGRTFNRTDLNNLRELARELETRIDSASSGIAINLTSFRRD